MQDDTIKSLKDSIQLLEGELEKVRESLRKAEQQGTLGSVPPSQETKEHSGENSVVQAPQPSSDVERSQPMATNEPELKPESTEADDKTKDGGEETIVGKEGYFDGIFMISDGDNKKYQLPPNYVSKSMLVIGDRLKIVGVDETGSRYSFKQLEHVDRRELEGILTKKDNQWAVHTSEGTYWVVAAAVKYFGGEIGDKAVIYLPLAVAPEQKIEWAALKELHKSDAAKRPQASLNVAPAPLTGSQTSPVEPAVVPQSPAVGQAMPPVTKPMVRPQFDQALSAPSTLVKPSGEMTGEVTVAHDAAAGSEAVGEVDLSEDELWELR